MAVGVLMLALQVAVPKPMQVVQRDPDGTGRVEIAGTLDGDQAEGAEAIEARFGSGPWREIVAKPPAGPFRGALEHIPTGRGRVTVRVRGQHRDDVEIADVGVGEVFVVIGQSNAEGRVPHRQRWRDALVGGTHDVPTPSFFRDVAWTEADDPAADGTKKGSVWPAVAAHLAEGTHVPIGFIVLARTATSLVKPPDWSPTGGDYARMNALVGAATGESRHVRAVLFWGGQGDVLHHVPRARFVTAVGELTAALHRDLGPSTALVLDEVGQVFDPRAQMPDVENIRAAQLDAVDQGVAVWGPGTCDLDPRMPDTDGRHLQAPAEVELAARHWSSAIRAHFFGGPARRPTLVGVRAAVDGATLTVTFDCGVDPSHTPPTAFEVQTGGLALDIARLESAPGADKRAVRLVLAQPVRGPFTVSFGRGNAGCALPAADPDGLAARPFLEAVPTP